MSLFTELKRRNVIRVAVAYVVTAWLVIQVVETIFPAFGFGDTAMRFVVIAFAIGLVPTLVLSWAFEITPEGVKKDSDVDRTSPIAHRAGKQLDRIIMVVLALALGYFAFDKFVLTPQRQAEKLTAATQEARREGRSDALVEAYGDKSIAVLPFLDMSADKDQEYMSDGIAEELLNLLAKIPDLRVISRSSSFAYKGEKIDIPAVAKKLNVAYVLEGSVRTAGNQLRITAQLIEAGSDTHLWSETYDRKLENIFQIQDDIAAAVVEALKFTLLGAVPQTRKTDQEAFRLELQARFFWNRRAPGDDEKAMDYYQQALAIDPGYAAAWTGLSVTYLAQASDGRMPREAGLAKAREAAETALSLDPDLADAHVRMGLVYEQEDNLEAARDEYRQAIALNPNSSLALGVMAYSIWRDGYLEEAIDLYQKAADIDPLTVFWQVGMAELLIKAGRLDEAEQALLKALELSPESQSAGGNMILIAFFRGQFSKALELTRLMPDGADKTFGLAVTYHAMGRHDESGTAMQQLADSPDMHAPHLLARAHASRGETDQAFEWLDENLETHNLRIGEIKFDPFLRNLHDDPRWDALLKKLEGLREASQGG